MDSLVTYRSRRGINQQQLASELGTSPGYLHDLETGRRKPSPALTRKIEELTGISRHELRPDIFGPMSERGAA